METSAMMFLDCPAYMDAHGTIRCGLPAEIQDRYLADSTDGALESAKIRCPRGHWFNGPVEFLTWGKNHHDGPQGNRRLSTRHPGGRAGRTPPDLARPTRSAGAGAGGPA
jgi:hypothetical protein